MSKIQRLVRALVNNKITNPFDYILLRSDDAGYIYVQEIKTKKEYKVQVEGKEPMCELSYIPMNSSNNVQKQTIINNDIKEKEQDLIKDIVKTVERKNNDFEHEKNKYEKKETKTELERLQEEIDNLKLKQEEELEKFKKRNNIKENVNELENKISNEISNNFYPDRIKGWQLLPVFVDSDGNVYHKGIQQPALKGTLPPTIFPKKK
jgi:hypothetical protein